MRKLIRYSAAAFLTWAVITFAWAAFSHVTGFVGPAEASEASLELAADAVILVDAPGVLGIPQRFTARQVYRAAHTAGQVHQLPEWAMGALLDRLGHASAHDRRHRHVHRFERRIEVEAPDILVLPFDELDGAGDRARRRAMIELQLHREQADRARARALRLQERAERIRERARRGAERARERAERRAEAARLRIGERERASREAIRRSAPGRPGAEAEALGQALERELEAMARELEAAASDDRKDELKRRIDEKLRELIDRLRRELEEAEIDLRAELEADGIRIESPARIRIRSR
ncbi:MAG: hypothetical protein R3266_03355 [Gemmatimonadota bacterium]|nr:hypothetical protein [Gemmatimonadota bacterium]